MAAQGYFGLDIGTSTIKAVQLERATSALKIVGAGIASCEAKKIFSESDIDREDLARIIAKLLSSSSITTDKVVSALPESQIFTRVIEMPLLNEKELASAIQWEAEQYIPIPVSDVVLDFQVLSRPQKEEANAKMEVLLVAAPKALVEKHIALLSSAGLEPQALDTEVMAMTRTLTDKTSPPTAIVSLGAYTTDICITHLGTLALTRSIASGGEAMTKSISEELSFDHDQAEEYKKTYGLLPDQLEGKIAQTIKPVFDIIISEVKKLILAYESKKERDQVKRVLIVGGGAKTPGVIEHLAEELGIEVAIGDPWFFLEKGPHITKDLLDNRPIFTVATGLALKKL